MNSGADEEYRETNTRFVKVGDLVITKLKNRWGLDCAGTVEQVFQETADVRVWNLNGPGADMLVTGIPLGELALEDALRCPDPIPQEKRDVGHTSELETGKRSLVLTLELAFIRWSVVHRQWHEYANDMPLLSAFLAGWMCRTIGATEPQSIGQFKSSFRAGWNEASDQIVIAGRQQ